jgi:hypothetical protein
MIVQQLEEIGEIVEENDRDIEDLQDEAYKLTDDLIDKYYDLKENQNEEIDGIIEKYLVRFDQSDAMMKQITVLEKLWKKSLRERDELEIRELQLKNQMMEREVIVLHEKMRQKNLLIAEIQKKLAKCLGVKKKVEEETEETIYKLFANGQTNGSSKRAVSPVPNSSNKQNLVWLKEKYSSYLFGYLKDVMDETRAYNSNTNGSINKSLFKSNFTGKDSRISSIRDPISENKNSKLKEFEELIESRRDQVQKLNNDLQKLNFEKSQLKGQKILIEKDLSEIGIGNSRLVEENQVLGQEFRVMKTQLHNMLKNPNVSYEDVINLVKSKFK